MTIEERILENIIAMRAVLASIQIDIAYLKGAKAEKNAAPDMPEAARPLKTEGCIEKSHNT